MDVSLENPKSDPALWERLKRYAFGFSDSGFLVDAVREETGLTIAQAERAVSEYRRFLYLVATDDQVLAPSRLIDKIWHLHLEDEKGYAEELCKRTIGRLINHCESRPAPFEDPAYAATLAHYRNEFGEQAFWKVWPTPDREGPRRFAMVVAFGLFGGGVVAFANSIPVLGGAMICLAVWSAIQFAVLSPWSANAGISTGCGGGSTDSDGGDGSGDGCGGD